VGDKFSTEITTCFNLNPTHIMTVESTTLSAYSDSLLPHCVHTWPLFFVKDKPLGIFKVCLLQLFQPQNRYTPNS